MPIKKQEFYIMKNNMKTKHFISILAAFFITSGLFAATSFSGYAGGKLNYAANPEETESGVIWNFLLIQVIY